MDTDKPRMFRRRTDKIYATLQQVQRRITQGTEPGEQPAGEQPAGGTVYTTGSSSYQPPARPQPPGMGRTISQAQANTGQGYLVTPDGRRISAEPDTSSHATATPSQTPEARAGSTPPVHPMEQALHRWDREPAAPAAPMISNAPSPAPGYQGSPSQAPEQQGGYAPPPGPQSYPPPPAHAASGRDGLTLNESTDAHANPALKMAASARSRPRRIELGIELATVLAIAWIGTIAVAFFIGRQTFTGGGFDEVADAGAGTQVSVRGSGAPDDDPLGDAGPRPPQPPAPQLPAGNGTEVLLLSSVPAYTREAEKKFQDMADKFNGAAAKGNFDPLFSVRRPRSGGGLQFVYGRVANGFGIKSDDARGKSITKALEGKFPTMRWIDLE